MKKVAFITSMLQPYRMTFFEKLSKSDPEIDWMILHGVAQTEIGKPGYKETTAFKNMGFMFHTYRIGPFAVRYNSGLLEAFKAYNPDLVIVISNTGNISSRMIVNWTKRHKKKLILWTCGWEPGLAKGLLLQLKRRMVSRFFSKADFHLTYSTYATKYAESLGVNPSIIKTCYNGIEIDDMLNQENYIIEKSAIVKEKYQLDKYYTFLYVGRLIHQKKPDMLVDAFLLLRKKYSNIKLIIIGDGPFKSQLVSKLEKVNDDHIYYLGRIIKDVDMYFHASDCMVLPGSGGLALNQAMFWSKICIVGKADGTEDDLIIEGKTGFRFEPDNLQSLSQAMERSINTSKTDARKMGEAAREIILIKSNVNNMVDIFLSTVRKLLSEN